jgi:hypothetical protein
MGGFF